MLLGIFYGGFVVFGVSSRDQVFGWWSVFLQLFDPTVLICLVALL